MSRRVRILLAIITLLLAVCSLAALIYALVPVETAHLQATLAPTLFGPP